MTFSVIPRTLEWEGVLLFCKNAVGEFDSLAEQDDLDFEVVNSIKKDNKNKTEPKNTF